MTPFRPQCLCLALLLLSPPFLHADDSRDPSSQIIDALVDAARDSDSEVRIAALRVLLKQPRSDAIVVTFRQGLQDTHVNARLIAVAGLVRSEGPTDEVLELLVSLLAKEEMRESAKRHLVDFGVAAIPAVEEALDSEETRLVAIELLGKLGKGESRADVIGRLIPQLEAKDASVRLATVRALAELLSVKSRPTKETYSRYLRYFHGLVVKYDSNKDGYLTEDEWKAMPKNPAEADNDKDGRVTAEELTIWSTKR